MMPVTNHTFLLPICVGLLVVSTVVSSATKLDSHTEAASRPNKIASVHRLSPPFKSLIVFEIQLYLPRDLIADTLKELYFLRVASGGQGRIIKRPMQGFRGLGKHGTGFSGVVTHGNNKIDR